MATLPIDNQPKLERIGVEISLILFKSDRENRPFPPLSHVAVTPPTKVERLDTLLAEELIVMRKKIERLRVERERTEAIRRGTRSWR